jgi:hypothetical protein
MRTRNVIGLLPVAWFYDAWVGELHCMTAESASGSRKGGEFFVTSLRQSENLHGCRKA